MIVHSSLLIISCYTKATFRFIPEWRQYRKREYYKAKAELTRGKWAEPSVIAAEYLKTDRFVRRLFLSHLCHHPSPTSRSRGQQGITSFISMGLYLSVFTEFISWCYIVHLVLFLFSFFFTRRRCYKVRSSVGLKSWCL